MNKKTIMAVAGLILACTAFSTFSVSAADNDDYRTTVFTPGDFKFIICDLPCKVKYVKGPCKITVRTNDKKGEPFSYGINAGRLEMKMNAKTLFVIKDSEVELSAPALEGIEFNGNGQFENESPISSDNFECRINGACKAEIEGLSCKTLQLVGNGASKLEIDELVCDTIDAKLNGTGRFEIEGKAGKGNFTVNGAGKIDITGLKVQDATSQVNGIGSVTKHK